MKLHQHCQQAFINLMSSKLRSFLAVLGILVGTAAVVALISCGQLATQAALAQFKALGTDLLAVSVFDKPQDRGRARPAQIPLEFWQTLPRKVPGVIQIAPYSTAYQTMSFQGKIVKGVIIGADDSLAQIIHLSMKQGRFVSFVHSFEHVCVIGHGLAQQIKEVSLEDPIGQQLRIGKALYTIIGVLNPWQENGFFNEDVNQSAIVPIAGMMLISKDAKINNIIFLLNPDFPIDRITNQIKEIISKQVPDLNLFIRSAKQLIASMESQGRIFTLLLAIIGSISLIVGGIGVMNVMLVSVTERKKEIGIRKAVGARNIDIQLLFLVEAVMLSLLGGVFGVTIGLIFTRIVAYFSHWAFTVYLTPPLIGFAVSVITGIFFGFYPARRAAVLEPIVSLRGD